MYGFGTRLLAAFALSTGAAAGLCAGGMLSEAARPSADALRVEKIDRAAPADLIILNGGLRDGLRPGLRCFAEVPGGDPAEILIVDSAMARSVALAVGASEISEGARVEFGVTR